MDKLVRELPATGVTSANVGDFIAQTYSEPFSWGTNDCALWCASAVRHMSGFDPAADLRGAYQTRFGAMRLQSQNGGLVRLVSSRMKGFSPIKSEGVALVRIGRDVVCALVVAGRAVLKSDRGVLCVEHYNVLCGWSWHRL